MKNIYICLNIFLFSICLYEQQEAPCLKWGKTYGGSSPETFAIVYPTQDGGYVFNASSLSNDGDVGNNHGGNDSWLVKTDSDGNIQWERNFGGSSIDLSVGFVTTSDGGYAMALTSSSSDGDVSGNNGNSDF